MRSSLKTALVTLEALIVAVVVTLSGLSFFHRVEAAFTSGGLNAVPTLPSGSSLFSPSQVSGIEVPKTLVAPSGAATQGLSSSPAVTNKVTTSSMQGLSGLFPFGGKVVTIHPNICGGMVHITVQSATGGTIDLMTTGGTKFYLYGPPTNPGQNVVGQYAPTQVTCSPTRFVSYSGGMVVMIGTSNIAGSAVDAAKDTAAQKVKETAKSSISSLISPSSLLTLGLAALSFFTGSSNTPQESQSQTLTAPPPLGSSRIVENNAVPVDFYSFHIGTLSETPVSQASVRGIAHWFVRKAYAAVTTVSAALRKLPAGFDPAVPGDVIVPAGVVNVGGLPKAPSGSCDSGLNGVVALSRAYSDEVALVCIKRTNGTESWHTITTLSLEGGVFPYESVRKAIASAASPVSELWYVHTHPVDAKLPPSILDLDGYEDGMISQRGRQEAGITAAVKVRAFAVDRTGSVWEYSGTGSYMRAQQDFDAGMKRLFANSPQAMQALARLAGGKGDFTQFEAFSMVAQIAQRAAEGQYGMEAAGVAQPLVYGEEYRLRARVFAVDASLFKHLKGGGSRTLPADMAAELLASRLQLFRDRAVSVSESKR
jgi:hypothetical protein